MDRWRPIDIFVLYLLAAASCADTHGGEGGKGDGEIVAGRGGTSTGSSGAGGGQTAPLAGAADGGGGQTSSIGAAADGGGGLQPGDECPTTSAPPATDSNRRVCAGGVMEWDGCKPRHEGVQCYVAELKDGHPDCLPDDDPTLIERLGDFVFSSGFGAEFVIESAPDVILPSSCEGAVACCGQQETEHFHQLACFDNLDDTDHGPVRCTDFGARQTRLGNDETWGKLCPTLKPEPSSADGEDAGAPEPSQHGLCCYRACGHQIDT